MNFIQRSLLLAVICFGAESMCRAQADNFNYEHKVIEESELDDYEYEQEEEDVEDTESITFEIESVEGQSVVDNIFEKVDVVNDLIQADSNIASWAVYSNESEIQSYVPNMKKDMFLTKRYDVIHLEDSTLYIREYLFNKNQAWDYIYERMYNKEGNLIFFVRHYNTYNSACAEVAFEESEYFFNNKGDLVKKSYSIYDNQNNPLSIEDCDMDREVYDKYSLLSEFLNAVPLPIDE